MAATPNNVGDRVERAIEDRADLEHEIERGEAAGEPERRHLVRTAIWLASRRSRCTSSRRACSTSSARGSDLEEIAPRWLGAMALLQRATLGCLWALQRVAVRARQWPPVITSQLAGNAMSKIAPGGGAVGAALQYRMLVEAGMDRTVVVGGLTAANLLIFAPVLGDAGPRHPSDDPRPRPARPGRRRRCRRAVFAVLAAARRVVPGRDGRCGIGRTVQRVRNRLRRNAEPLTGCPRLLHERDRILETLGPQWKRALLATVGRWAFDYATLLAALAAVGSHPRPALVLLAFCAAQLLAQIPITPGGLGFVEAGLTAMLALAGVPAGDAVLATFAYRLFSYWLPLPVGLVAYVVHRRLVAPGG